MSALAVLVATGAEAGALGAEGFAVVVKVLSLPSAVVPALSDTTMRKWYKVPADRFDIVLLCDVFRAESLPSELVYEVVVPYRISDVADFEVVQVIVALVVETPVETFEITGADAGAGGVVVAVVVDVEVAVFVSLVGGVVVACGELVCPEEFEVVESAVCVGGCSGSGSGSGVASVVKVSSPVIAAVPLESITTTR